MTKRVRCVLWGGGILGGIALIALGVYFRHIGLDSADKVSSIIGAFVGLVALALTIGSALPARRAKEEPGQSVHDNAVGGAVTQIRDVHGDVRIGFPDTGDRRKTDH